MTTASEVERAREDLLELIEALAAAVRRRHGGHIELALYKVRRASRELARLETRAHRGILAPMVR